MKKLITTIFTLTLFGGTALADNTTLPQKFCDYQKNAKKISNQIVQVEENFFERRDYDLDGDEIQDDEEIILDDAADGWNGNERWYIPKNYV